jgi:hypothetical protein
MVTAGIGGGSGLPMATAVVVMLVLMEAVVVTRWCGDGGVCCGAGQGYLGGGNCRE